jgi:hypothetical protein
MTSRLMLVFAGLAAGCVDKGDDSGASECGSTQGFVSGALTGPSGGAASSGAQVLAVDSAGASHSGEVAADGSYELNLDPGIYIVTATDGVCWSEDRMIEVEVCSEQVLDLAIENCDTADKPNLYLYPERDQPTSVVLRHGPRQSVFASAPTYGQGWWGVAHVDGTFSVEGERWPYLFYELSLRGWQSELFQRDEGWCLAEDGAVDAMSELLGDYGFDARERLDFVEGWEHDLPPSRHGYAVYPQTEVEHAGGVVIRPALPLSRLWLLVEDGAACDVDAPGVEPFDRAGPHAVEWGVVLHDLAR